MKAYPYLVMPGEKIDVRVQLRSVNTTKHVDVEQDKDLQGEQELDERVQPVKPLKG